MMLPLLFSTFRLSGNLQGNAATFFLLRFQAFIQPDAFIVVKQHFLLNRKC